MWQTYEDYCAEMEYLKAVPLPEEIWRREYAPKDEAYREPLIITPKNRNRPMSATLENHIANVGKMVPKPKKKYAPRISRKGWTTEQIKARRSENSQKCKARKKLAQVIL
ncbi:MAG: hypothetical protein PHI47_06340 [Sulfuricurvum sp.]|uniref:hypothetical protein n=1 Tax=Sulfuricurvum sp. TaxID=2025608 RepID=UPI00263266F5|nr:hypothetical protein [Sulfuricurvum sp.]MDD5159652.1 hypothetical protein [Sulfuricurvum sp.]